MKKLVALVSVLAIASIARAELMPDGGFESGSWSGNGGFVYRAAPNSTMWGYANNDRVAGNAHNGNFYFRTQMPQSGTAYTYSYTTYGFVNDFTYDNAGWAAIWQQGLAASEGDVLQASAYVKDLQADGSGDVISEVAMLKIEYYDAADQWISVDQEFLDVPKSGLWTQIVGSAFTAPAGTASVTMVVGIESWHNGSTRSIGWDDVSLVPEPTTFVLVTGLAGLFLMRRRR